MNKKIDYITIGGKKIKCEVKEIDIFKLKYYRQNPRVFSILSTFPDDVTQEVIEQKLWQLDSTKELFQDIKRNKGLIEEIIVKGDEVLEGNSRLCAYRKLFERASSEEEKKLWRYIRAKILPKDITKEQIFVILGTFHIKGKAKWIPYEQASYLYRMVEEFNKSTKELSSMIGVGENVIKVAIESYKTMNDAGIRDLNKFSFFVEYFKNRELKKLREENPYLTNEFIKWVKEGRIPRAEKVRDLPTILKDKKAKKSFWYDGEDFEECLYIAHKRHPEAIDSFYSNLKKTTRLLRDAPTQKIMEEIERNKTKKAIIKYLAREVKRFCKNLNIKF